MSELWATLVGGGIALTGSIGSTVFVQSRVPITERRNRVQRAADQLIADLSKLQTLGNEPDDHPEDSEWVNIRDGLVTSIGAQAHLLSSAELRGRVTAVVAGLSDYLLLYHVGGLSEARTRKALCEEGLQCIGAYMRGDKKLPPALPIVARVKDVFDEWEEVTEQEAKVRAAQKKVSSPVVKTSSDPGTGDD